MDFLKMTIMKLLVTVIIIKTVVSAISWDSACGSTKGCFPDCTGGCDYLVTWQDTSTNIDFVIQVEETGTSKYVAIGFSDDRTSMGDDSVVGCIVPGGGSVRSYYNEGTDTDELSPNSLGLSGVSVAQVNGVITCTFTRSYDETDDKFFNLKNDYLILLVVGEAEQEDSTWELDDHEKIPWSSDKKVDFNTHLVYGLYKLNSPAVKIHGIMMVLAWLLLVVVGIITARYNKDMLPEHKLLGTKVWFQVHRGAMVTAVLFVAIGFISIFIDIGGYSEIVSPSSKEVVHAHPILGIIVTVLCFINPIMGVLRPGGDHEFRWIFNWAHLGVGVIAQVLATVTIFLGYLLERSMLPSSVIWVTIVHLIVVAGISIALEVNKWMTIRSKKHGIDNNATTGMELEDKTEEKTEPSKPSSLPFILLLVLGGLVFALCLAILIIIAVS